MLTPSWVRSAAGVVLAVALIAGPSYCAGRDAGRTSARNADLKAVHAAEDSLTMLQARDSAQMDSAARVTDSLHAANGELAAKNAQLAAHIATLVQRVTIQSPTVIAVDTATEGHAPLVLATVPPRVTALIQGLEAQNAQQAVLIGGLRQENAALRVAFAHADSGWAQAKALAALQQREIATINASQPKIGAKTGYVFGALTTLGLVYAIGRLN